MKGINGDASTSSHFSCHSASVLERLEAVRTRVFAAAGDGEASLEEDLYALNVSCIHDLIAEFVKCFAPVEPVSTQQDVLKGLRATRALSPGCTYMYIA